MTPLTGFAPGVRPGGGVHGCSPPAIRATNAHAARVAPFPVVVAAAARRFVPSQARLAYVRSSAVSSDLPLVRTIRSVAWIYLCLGGVLNLVDAGGSADRLYGDLSIGIENDPPIGVEF